jgi:Ribbon-helix-helix protein, copG family
VDKTTLYLEPSDYRRLKRIAAEQGRSPAALVREAVSEYVTRHGRASLPASVGAFGSGRRDLSERAEELLEGFGEASSPRRARPNARGRR